MVRISGQQAELYALRGASRGVELRNKLAAVLRALLADGVASVFMPTRAPADLQATLRATGFLQRVDEDCLIAFAGARHMTPQLRHALKTVPLSRADLDVA